MESDDRQDGSSFTSVFSGSLIGEGRELDY
jgi:hypothetical protein